MRNIMFLLLLVALTVIAVANPAMARSTGPPTFVADDMAIGEATDVPANSLALMVVEATPCIVNNATNVAATAWQTTKNDKDDDGLAIEVGCGPMMVLTMIRGNGIEVAALRTENVVRPVVAITKLGRVVTIDEPATTTNQIEVGCEEQILGTVQKAEACSAVQATFADEGYSSPPNMEVATSSRAWVGLLVGP